MKKLNIALVILIILSVGSLFCIAADPNPPPDYVDVFDIPKESIINPYNSYGTCTGSLYWLSDWDVMIDVNCPNGEIAVPGFSLQYNRYMKDGKIRLRMLWFSYVVANELYFFEFDEEKAKFYRKK